MYFPSFDEDMFALIIYKSGISQSPLYVNLTLTTLQSKSQHVFVSVCIDWPHITVVSLKCFVKWVILLWVAISSCYETDV